MLVDENQFPGLTIKAPLLMDGLHEAAQTIGRQVAYDGKLHPTGVFFHDVPRSWILAWTSFPGIPPTG